MSKDISQYLHLYLGCECKSSEGTMVYKLSSIDIKGRAMFYDGYGNEIWLGNDYKPILKKLSDMIEEEAIKLAGLSEWGPHFRDVKTERNKITNDIIVTWDGMSESREEFNATGELFYCAEQFLWLLSKHFDLFGLIEAGLAIDKTTLNQQ